MSRRARPTPTGVQDTAKAARNAANVADGCGFRTIETHAAFVALAGCLLCLNKHVPGSKVQPAASSSHSQFIR